MTALDRRGALRLALGAVALAARPVSALADGAPPQVIVVSRDRVLRETAAGRALRRAEREFSSAFQARVDAVQQEMAAEEAELARERRTLTRAEFDRRAARFDRKVRIARRRSQRQAAELQTAMRRARERLIAELAPVLIETLRAKGASVVLDADQVLIAAPSVDMTETVIELFDERVAAPEIVMRDPGPLLPSEAELDAAQGAEPQPD